MVDGGSSKHCGGSLILGRNAYISTTTPVGARSMGKNVGNRVVTGEKCSHWPIVRLVLLMYPKDLGTV